MTVYMWGEKRYLVLYGGTFWGGERDGQVSTDFIFIDICVSPPEWFVLQVVGSESTVVQPRISTFLLPVRDRIFVFGGSDLDGNIYRSYSEATYSEAEESWVLSRVDFPYPEEGAALGTSMDGAVVCSGEKLLLTTGMGTDEESITFAPESYVILDTTNYTFIAFEGTPGDFPKEFLYYKIWNFPPSTAPSPRDAESIVICTWKDLKSPPEFWQYDVEPVPRSQRLELTEPLPVLPAGYKLDDFLRVGDRFLLMGVKNRTYTYGCCVFISFVGH